mmetsp:Transcript_7807/g.23595  ORF Transcript_7807/g.23595 Transcript_7807/m.23595 type:complete len:135 (+) Transcript_7807:552-956(+)
MVIVATRTLQVFRIAPKAALCPRRQALFRHRSGPYCRHRVWYAAALADYRPLQASSLTVASATPKVLIHAFMRTRGLLPAASSQLPATARGVAWLKSSTLLPCVGSGAVNTAIFQLSNKLFAAVEESTQSWFTH